MAKLNSQFQNQVADLLKTVLADHFLLYTKSRNYHWNVTGPNFYGLHAVFEKIYDELAEDLDAIAERIRALGFKAPGTLKEFLELSSIKEEPGKFPIQSVMAQNITKDLGTIIEKMKSAANKMQNDFKDEVTAGMFYSLIEKYQKTVWMLKSTVEQ
jgi:starvation-inducible DNA-binding protein